MSMKFVLFQLLLLVGAAVTASSSYSAGPPSSSTPHQQQMYHSTPQQETALPVHRTELSSAPVANRAPVQYREPTNELPDQLQWDTIDKLQRDKVLEFIQRTLLEVTHANDFSSRGSPQTGTAKLMSGGGAENPLYTLATRLCSAELVVRNLTFLMALVYMDRLAMQVVAYIRAISE